VEVNGNVRYWFRRSHDCLEDGSRAGLVGTNTVRQNYSREASLDYITTQGGTITEAVSSMVWPGDAVVHVSIVNWIKGKTDGLKQLFFQEGNKAGIDSATCVSLPRNYSTGFLKIYSLNENKNSPKEG
jgi:hypothetical protein